jgi:hypothetical protein
LNSPFRTLFILLFQVIHFVPEVSNFDVHWFFYTSRCRTVFSSIAR